MSLVEQVCVSKECLTRKEFVTLGGAAAAAATATSTSTSTTSTAAAEAARVVAEGVGPSTVENVAGGALEAFADANKTVKGRAGSSRVWHAWRRQPVRRQLRYT
jgi:hypothetical protein